jgi:hypothetical protein
MNDNLSADGTCSVSDQLDSRACAPPTASNIEIAEAFVVGVIGEFRTDPSRANTIRVAAHRRGKVLTGKRDGDAVRLVPSASAVRHRAGPPLSKGQPVPPADTEPVAAKSTTVDTPVVKIAKRIILRKSTPTYFTAKFLYYVGRIVDNRCCGESVATIVNKYGGISESTLKAALGGRRVGPRSINQLAETTFRLDPLSALEFKIRFAENYLQRYLVEKYAKADELQQVNLAAFFNRRLAKPRSPAVRLAQFLSGALAQTKKDRADLSGESPLDECDLPYSTVTAACRGDRTTFSVFATICRRLDLKPQSLTCARILFVERLLGQTLLGSDETLFYHPPEVLPRLGALLTFSANRVWELA